MDWQWHYGFPTVMTSRLGRPPTPADTKAFFDEQGLDLSREFWRQLLAAPPRRPDLETWLHICEGLRLPFGVLLNYEPTGVMPPPKRSPKRAKPQREQKPPKGRPAAGPPNPWDFFRRDDDG